MTEVFEGYVKAHVPKVELAIEKYTTALDEATAIVEALREKAKTDVRVKKGWFGIKYSKTVADWIKDIPRELWFITDVELLQKYYPEQITKRQVNKVTTRHTSSVHSVKAMFEHNPEDMYLTPTQAQWVETWSKR